MKRMLVIWGAMGAAYVAIETLWRGHSHPSMLVVGGLCGVLVGAINQTALLRKSPVAVQSLLGALIVLDVELLAGCILNLWLGLGVWDYSTLPGNFLGQICPLFGVLWFFLMPLAIWAEDTARWLFWSWETLLGKPHSAPAPDLKPYSLPGVYKAFFLGNGTAVLPVSEEPRPDTCG